MATSHMKSVLVMGLVAIPVLFLAYRELSASDPKASPPQYKAISGVDRFKGYKRWTRVNPKPIYLEPLTATPSQAQKEFDRQNPHTQKFFTVYVNGIGKKAMLEEVTPAFPVGSIIVKEKLPTRDSKEPELLTAMLKREKGYDTPNGDWEYLVLNGTASKIDSSGKLANCQSCHASQKSTGFVFRTYYQVPAAGKKAK
jgi:hypothetical protein